MHRYLVILASLLAFSVPDPVSAAGVTQKQSVLIWHPCEDVALAGWQCAKFNVPKNYKDRSAGTFDLAVVRLRSTGKARQRIGSLFVNAGGPGIATISDAPVLASLLPSRLRERFDFVAWDPRGVGLSNSLEECSGASVSLPATGPVDWTAVLTKLRASQAEVNQACEQRYPDVVPYIGTNNTVRDLDALRQAVGDTKLTYWGPSYGSRIGYVYARIFPTRVRAMIATGAVNPNGSLADLARGIGFAPDDALGFFFETYPGSREKYQRANEALNQQPLLLPSGDGFTRWDLAVQLFFASAYESDWPKANRLLTDLEVAFSGSEKDKLNALKELDKGLHNDGIVGQGPSEVFINCLDYPDRTTLEQQLELTAQMRADGPIVASVLATFPMECSGMTVTPDPVPVNFTPDRRTPMLISTATNDGRTPYHWTEAMAQAFPRSRTISYRGGNHTTFLTARSECVDTIGVKFLEYRRLPVSDQTCPNVITGR